MNLTVNGVDDKDNTVGGPVMQMPLEAIQEFVISTQRFSAAKAPKAAGALGPYPLRRGVSPVSDRPERSARQTDAECIRGKL